MNFHLFAAKHNILIPVQYVFFEEKFDLNNLIVRFYDEDERFYFRLTKWLIFRNESIELKIDEIFGKSDIFEIWDRHVVLWGEPIQFLPIGSLTSPASGLLLISIETETFGQIWYARQGERIPFYAEKDLATFMLAVTQEFREDKGDLLCRLYKNWGEDFWRIKNTSISN